MHALRTCTAGGWRARSLSVRCEQQGAKGGGGGGGVDVWLSRGAMLGFVGAVTVELTTGKGVLQVWLLLVVFPSCLLRCRRMWD